MTYCLRLYQLAASYTVTEPRLHSFLRSPADLTRRLTTGMPNAEGENVPHNKPTHCGGSTALLLIQVEFESTGAAKFMRGERLEGG